MHTQYAFISLLSRLIEKDLIHRQVDMSLVR